VSCARIVHGQRDRGAETSCKDTDEGERGVRRAESRK
jgi:hypothetical protein